MTYWIIQILNGISFGMVLFLLASGLSLVFGLMRVLNLAHGSFYLFGGYVGLTVIAETDSYVLGILSALAAIALLGIILERFFLRRLYLEELPQALLTFGFLFIIGDITLWIWGGGPKTVPLPAVFDFSIHLDGLVYPFYRLLLVGIGLLVALGLWLLQERTRLGASLRAAVDDEETARAMGINVSTLFTTVFAIGAALAALAGVLNGTLLGVHPGADFEVLLLSFVVVIIGGIGSIGGAFVGALMVGLLDNFGRALFPEFALFTIFVPMALILLVRPSGLWGRQ